MRTLILSVLAATLLFLLPAFNTPLQDKDNQLTAKEKRQGWVLLFDGNTLNGWKNYKGRNADGWAVANGELVCREEGVKSRADLITVDAFDDFELSIDWKIAPKRNSGIIYRCTEDNGASFESGPEYQLIDDIGYPDPLHDKQYSGSNYDMNAPSSRTANPAGTYNHTRIVVNKDHVEHWLNGVKVVAYNFGSPEWEQNKAISKWKDVKPYGQSKSGHIALQDHGGGVTFKNIKIRKL